VHLEVGAVVLGEDDVDVPGRDAQGGLELGDDGQGELALLGGGTAAAQVGVEEGRPAGGGRSGRRPGLRERGSGG